MTPEQSEVLAMKSYGLSPRWPPALSNALLIEQIESQNMLPGVVSVFEPIKETHMTACRRR
ncbi:hypothetical protein KCP69_08695 [Salmonella enterica subsp. enterica]|nr:hypothetical protein KCP69_08695 [Salmonella enterica subsp. enterica]